MIRPACFLLPFALAGCVGAVTTVVKAPFKVAGKAVDWTTTSPSERDRAYTRKMRKQQERAERARRDLARRCARHPADTACAASDDTPRR